MGLILIICFIYPSPSKLLFQHRSNIYIIDAVYYILFKYSVFKIWYVFFLLVIEEMGLGNKR